MFAVQTQDTWVWDPELAYLLLLCALLYSRSHELVVLHIDLEFKNGSEIYVDILASKLGDIA